MTETPDCKPWCTEHSFPHSCITRFGIYHDGAEAKPAPVPGSLAAQFQALGGFPPQINWVSAAVCHDADDEQTITELQFFVTGAREENCILSLNPDQLKALHASLGDIIRDFP